MSGSATLGRARNAAAATLNTSSSVDVNWRATLYQPMQAAAKIIGVSPASLYRLEAEGKLNLRRLAGRTLIETPSLIALADSAEAWSASKRSEQAVQARVGRARAAWQE
jgi:hypothetical protein